MNVFRPNAQDLFIFPNRMQKYYHVGDEPVQRKG